jgi:hypothetical protein
MKYIYLLFAVGFITLSCEPKNDEPSATLETLTVSQVTMPVKFAKDSITEIPIDYIRPTVCHSFYDFYYEKSGTSCPVSQLSYTATLKFKPAALGTYHFKFWSSTDAQGVDQFFEYDAVVNH